MTTAFAGGDEPPPKLELHAESAAAMASIAAVERIKLRINNHSPRNVRATHRHGSSLLRGGASHGEGNARQAVSFHRPFCSQPAVRRRAGSALS